jgi:hypothetical protein
VAEGNNNLSEFYAAADLFTILSCGEGCGQVLNEAEGTNLKLADITNLDTAQGWVDDFLGKYSDK